MSLKQKLLFELESNRETSISGQMLAQKLGVSRNAVWKAINALRQEGYEVLSCTNKGYRLADSSDLLSAEGITRYLSEQSKKLPIYFFSEIDSTNNEAKRRLANGLACDTLIVAGYQSAGRGRGDHAFYSPKTGAYLSLVLHPQTSVSDTVGITAAAAVAVTRAIESLTDKTPMIKWVNDIFLGGKKIVGILTEAVTDFESGTVQSVIVGIGINIKATDFPEEISGIAGSLEPYGITRNQIAAEIVNQLLVLTKNLSDHSYLDEYREHSMVLGKEITYRKGGKTYRAVATDINDSGALLVQNQDGSRDTLGSGEISIRFDRP